MLLAPEIEGTVPIRSPEAPFMQAFHRRVAAGLLLGRPHPRSNYRITESGPAHLRLRAADWRTALNVGLNEVELAPSGAGTVRYRVRYRRWAGFCLGLGGALGLIGLTLLLTLDVQGYIARHASSRVPGLSDRQNLMIAWGMVLFWGFVWPWLLIALHKGSLRRLTERLIHEVDEGAAGAAFGLGSSLHR